MQFRLQKIEFKLIGDKFLKDKFIFNLFEVHCHLHSLWTTFANRKVIDENGHFFPYISVIWRKKLWRIMTNFVGFAFNFQIFLFFFHKSLFLS